MCAFDELMAHIATRPAIYVGRQSLRGVSVYLDGYTQALTDNGHADPLHGWAMWIYHRFQIWHAGWHWTRVLLHVYGTDADALSALVPLYTEYANRRASLDVDALELDLLAQLKAKYGQDWHEPDTTHTTAGG